LVHACLEGPEVGVYYRGESKIEEGKESVKIKLPNYVEKLAKDLTVHITPIYNANISKKYYDKPLLTSRVKEGEFEVYGNPIEFSWLAIGKRSDLYVEPNKNEVELNGSGPYKWINKL
jgi:hypothetical protein